VTDEPAPVDLTLRIGSDRFDEDDDNWLEQEAGLVAELSREAGGLRREAVAVPGSKGLVESLILALGSAGAFKAAAQCMRAWLARDRTRRIELSWTVDGREERVVLQGNAIDPAAIDRLAEIVRARIGG
jgi:Effector Associated Constant Component 1